MTTKQPSRGWSSVVRCQTIGPSCSTRRERGDEQGFDSSLASFSARRAHHTTRHTARPSLSGTCANVSEGLGVACLQAAFSAARLHALKGRICDTLPSTFHLVWSYSRFPIEKAIYPTPWTLRSDPAPCIRRRRLSRKLGSVPCSSQVTYQFSHGGNGTGMRIIVGCLVLTVCSRSRGA